MRKREKLAAFIVASITFATLTGCTSQSSTNLEINSAVAISLDVSGLSSAKSVIALANGSAEIISALGLKSILIGRDIASTDSDLKDIPIVTSGHQVVAEKIIALGPDLLLIDKTTGPAQALDTIRSAGISVVEIPEVWQLNQIPEKVNSVATAIGAPDLGRQLNVAMQSQIVKLRKSTARTRIIFLYLRGGSAIYLIGGKGSGADSLIKAIGALDVGAEELANPFNALSSEVMATLNPEIILVMTNGLASVGGVDGLVALPGIAQTLAGREKKIIAVDDSLLLSFGPRTPDLLLQLQAAILKLARQ
ncbi:MAG: ABC transporter substrate-binding protein [Candidatus Planktophila sp.]